MKMNARIFGWSCLAILLLAGCGSNVVLDNPRKEAVVFSFDGNTEYTVAAGAQQEISLDEGKHQVTVKNDAGQVLGDTTFNLKDEGIVHAGGSDYVVWRQLYGVTKDRKTLLNEDWTMVDSTKYFGDIKVYPASWLFLDKNWDIPLAEKMPESQALYVNKDYEIQSKVFRAEDFVATYREMSDKNKKPD
jgi:hypothetical protein